MIVKKCLLLICALVIGTSTLVKAQDFMFTQSFAFPLELNPALTGAYDGSFRVSGIYRSQWGGLLENPWKTFGVSGDLRFDLSKKNHDDFIGAGVAFVSDRVPDFDFNTMGIKMSGAFHKSLDSRNNQYLSGGMYFGLMQRNVNIQALSFDDQFNGLDGYTNSTLENLPVNNFAYFDLGLGLNYAVKASETTHLAIGGSVAHVNQPSASFSVRSPEITEPTDVPLYMRWAVYTAATFTLDRNVSIMPRILVAGQDKALMSNIGANVRFTMNKYDTNALQLGTGVQLAKDLGNIGLNTIYLFAGVEFGRALVGLSYDFNMDDLANEGRGQGIFELSVSYIGDYENDAEFCPKF